MTAIRSRSLAAALLGAGLLPASQVGAQMVGGPLTPTAEPVMLPAAQQVAVPAPRSGLWQTVEAAHRRQAEVPEHNPHRLSDAQRQEMRDQIRRASLRMDGPPMAAPATQP